MSAAELFMQAAEQEVVRLRYSTGRDYPDCRVSKLARTAYDRKLSKNLSIVLSALKEIVAQGGVINKRIVEQKAVDIRDIGMSIQIGNICRKLPAFNGVA